MESRETEEPEEQAPRSLGQSLRWSVSAFVDEIVLFLLLNAAWVAAFAALAFAWSLVPFLWLLAPVMALPTAVLTRLAVAAARGDAPSWRMVGPELRRRPWRKLAIAAVQLLLMAFAAANIAIAPDMGGVVGIVSLAVAVYVAIAVGAYALALWPIVCDPIRDGPLRPQLRVAAAVVLLRPLQLFVLLVVTVLSIVVALQIIVPALFLTSLVILAVAAYVVPAADALVPPR